MEYLEIKKGRHYHKAQYLGETLLDECEVCDESWRNTDVHIHSIPVAQREA